MRFALRLLLPALVLLGPMQGRASAVTIQELLEFKGKLSDDVLVALIESDGSVFHLSIGDVASLKEKGLSEKVILAMLKTATKPQTMPAPQPVARHRSRSTRRRRPIRTASRLSTRRSRRRPSSTTRRIRDSPPRKRRWSSMSGRT